MIVVMDVNLVVERHTGGRDDDGDTAATFLSGPVTLFVAFLFPSLDHFIARRPVERTGPVSVILELLLVDVDSAGEHVVAVSRPCCNRTL